MASSGSADQGAGGQKREWVPEAEYRAGRHAQRRLHRTKTVQAPFQHTGKLREDQVKQIMDFAWQRENSMRHSDPDKSWTPQKDLHDAGLRFRKKDLEEALADSDVRPHEGWTS